MKGKEEKEQVSQQRKKLNKISPKGNKNHLLKRMQSPLLKGMGVRNLHLRKKPKVQKPRRKLQKRKGHNPFQTSHLTTKNQNQISKLKLSPPLPKGPGIHNPPLPKGPGVQIPRTKVRKSEVLKLLPRRKGDVDEEKRKQLTNKPSPNNNKLKHLNPHLLKGPEILRTHLLKKTEVHKKPLLRRPRIHKQSLLKSYQFQLPHPFQ